MKRSFPEGAQCEEATYYHGSAPRPEEFYHTNVPDFAGDFFWTQKEMLEAYFKEKERNQRLFAVCWDKTASGKKAYGFFSDPMKYFDTIQKMPEEKRSGYEMVMSSTRCKLHLDVEWVCEGSCADPQAEEIVKGICDSIEEKAGRSCVFSLSTCSRLSTKKKNMVILYKNSFHIVVHNVIFANNHDGTMCQFVKSLGNNEYIDGGIYTLNRFIRTEKASKFGERSFFRAFWLSGEKVPDLSREEEEKRLVKSLITVFDESLATFETGFKPLCGKIVKGGGEAREKTKSQKIGEIGIHSGSSPVMIARKESGPSLITKDETDLYVIPEHFLKFMQGSTGAVFQVRKVEDNEKGMPWAIQALLNNKNVDASDIRFIYVKGAQQCINSLIRGHKHTHSSNNARAYTVSINGRVDVYIKCWGCKADEFSMLCKEDSNGMLPCLKKNHTLRAIIESPWGLENVADSHERKRVAKLYQQMKGDRKKLMELNMKDRYPNSAAYVWKKYVETAAEGWILLSERKQQS